MDTHPFHQLYIHMLSELYSIESQIQEVLPTVSGSASSSELREAFENYLDESKTHVQNLHQIFEELKEKPTGMKSNAMQAMIDDTRKVALEGGNSEVKDAALIAMVQRMEHYKMAIYGTVRTFAKHLNHQEVIALLQLALNQEGQSNKKLIKIAEGGFLTTGINTAACKVKTRT